MAQAEKPERRNRPVTADDIRQLTGAATPHFALQIRARLATLIQPLAVGDPARVLGEREMERLAVLGLTGETRGNEGPRERPLRSLDLS